MAVIKPEVDITFERREMAKRFQLLPPMFGLARLEYDTVYLVRHSAASPDVGRLPTVKMAATKTGNGNKN